MAASNFRTQRNWIGCSKREMLAHLLKRRHSVAYSEIVSSVSWQSRRVLTIHREAMENFKSCACGGQNPPKVMVYLEEKKTNFAEDKRHHRLPVTKILDKKDILYITSAAKDGDKNFCRVVTAEGIFYSQHPLRDWVEILLNGVQVNKSNVLNMDHVTNTNEWYFAYIETAEGRTPFEVNSDYRDDFKVKMSGLCTLPFKRKKNTEWPEGTLQKWGVPFYFICSLGRVTCPFDALIKNGKWTKTVWLNSKYKHTTTWKKQQTYQQQRTRIEPRQSLCTRQSLVSIPRLHRQLVFTGARRGETSPLRAPYLYPI